MRGQPLYAKGLLEEGKYSTDRQILSIQLNEVESLPVETEAMDDNEMRDTGSSFPEDIEVWVGGSLQSSFRRDSFTVKAKSSHDDVLLLMVCFPGCYVFMKTKWTNENNNEQKIGETLARLVGDNCGLFEFLADPSKTHQFIGVSLPVEGINQKLIATATSGIPKNERDSGTSPSPQHRRATESPPLSGGSATARSA